MSINTGIGSDRLRRCISGLAGTEAACLNRPRVVRCQSCVGFERLSGRLRLEILEAFSVSLASSLRLFIPSLSLSWSIVAVGSIVAYRKQSDNSLRSLELVVGIRFFRSSNDNKHVQRIIVCRQTYRQKVTIF